MPSRVAGFLSGISRVAEDKLVGNTFGLSRVSRSITRTLRVSRGIDFQDNIVLMFHNGPLSLDSDVSSYNLHIAHNHRV